MSLTRCRTCCMPDCGRPARYFELCYRHLKTHKPPTIEKSELTHAVAWSMLDYNPDTGLFTWKVQRKAMMAGSTAGSRVGRYLRISIFDQPYSAHRLAVFMMTGHWPASQVDHINGDPLDNRWSNLRAVDSKINAQNVRKPSKRNSLGVLGVSRFKSKFKATIQVDGRSVHLGYHATPELAYEAYVHAKRKLHEGNTL